MIISSETSCNDGVTITAHKQSINAIVLAKDKQLPLTVRKTTPSDVRYQDSGLSRKTTENFTSLVGGLNRDAATKVSGYKRLKAEPPSGFSFYHALDHTHGNEHIMNARRRFELELGGGRKLRYTDTLVKFSDSRQSLGEHARETNQPTTNYMVSSQDKLCDGPSAPSFLRKYDSDMEAIHVDSVKPIVKCHDSIAFEGYDDLQWREQLERLQKRAIELTIEEGKELQRMKCMNILGTSFQTNNSVWHQYLQARK